VHDVSRAEDVFLLVSQSVAVQLPPDGFPNAAA
jgi:hypothetical protein